MADEWKVWTKDTRYPVFTGAEEDARQYVIDQNPNGPDDAYVETPTGDIEVYKDQRWVPD